MKVGRELLGGVGGGVLFSVTGTGRDCGRGAWQCWGGLFLCANVCSEGTGFCFFGLNLILSNQSIKR